MRKGGLSFLLGFLLALPIVRAVSFEDVFVDGINFIFGAETSTALLKFGLFIILLAIIGHIMNKYIFPDNTMVSIVISLAISWLSVRFFPEAYLEVVRDVSPIMVSIILIFALLVLPFIVAEWISPGNKRMRMILYVIIVGGLIYGAYFAYDRSIFQNAILEDVVYFIGQHVWWVIIGSILAYAFIKWLFKDKSQSGLTEEQKYIRDKRDEKRMHKEKIRVDKDIASKDRMSSFGTSVAGKVIDRFSGSKYQGKKK